MSVNKDKLHITFCILPLSCWLLVSLLLLYLSFFILPSTSNYCELPLFTVYHCHPLLPLEYRCIHCFRCSQHLYWLCDILWQEWFLVIYLQLWLRRWSEMHVEKWRRNNIIIVKCFISSFAGKHIHQCSWGKQEPGMRGPSGALVVFTAFISLLMTGDSNAEHRSSIVPSTGAQGQWILLRETSWERSAGWYSLSSFGV